MDLNLKSTQNNRKPKLALTAFVLLGLAGPLFATAPTTGQFTLINGLANVINGTVGASASAVKVVVSDSTGACSTTASVAYGGLVTVAWNAASTHSSTVCTNIASVAVTALKTSSGVVQYDSTANTTPPATATAATTFTAPTTAISNLALIVTGETSAAMTNSATVWGSAIGVAPIYIAGNGVLSTTGIMGGVGSAGIKAASLMQRYAVTPAVDNVN